MSELKVVEIDESLIEWKQLISKNGKQYEIGFLPDASFASSSSSSKTPFAINVYWPVTSPKTFVEVTGKDRDASAITKYALYPQDSGYQYRLEFINEKHYNYAFTDESGDSYGCDTYRNGTHFIRYSSKQPTIVTVSGD